MPERKTALITGASRGIGKAIAIKLASESYNVIINYNKSKMMAENLAKELTAKYGVKAVAYKADVSSVDEINNLVKYCYYNFETIDVLVNNAGVCFDTNVLNRTVSQFVDTFKTNVFGVFHLSRLIGQKMKNDGYGKIINISSNNAINCFHPDSIDYDASKAALNVMTRDLAIEFAPHVNVNAVAPGWIATEMNKDLSPDIMALEKERVLKKRIGAPIDVANLVSFLVSDKADYINGAIIVIDGGMFR